jgi:drug/metabolite transporter (DMT)-like permease
MHRIWSFFIFNCFLFHFYAFSLIKYSNLSYLNQNLLLKSKKLSKFTLFYQQDDHTTKSSPINTKSTINNTILSPTLSFLILNTVAIIWGSQHVLIKSTLTNYSSPSILNFWRFTLSTLPFVLPIIQLIKSKNSLKDSPGLITAGMELGLYTFLGFALQSIGLEITTASRSAFLLYLNVKIVPFLSYILYNKAISLSTWISAMLALIGSLLLSTDGGWLNIGDIWSIAAAIASALFILRLERFAKTYNDAGQLNAISFLTGELRRAKC